MHEMALVREVLNVVLAECATRPVKGVKAVHLTIGELRDVVDEYVPGLFAHLARGTVAEGAVITIEHTPYRVRCNQCGELFTPDLKNPKSWVCPGCGAARDYSPYSGMEFRIDAIEAVPLAQKPAAQQSAVSK